MRAFSQTQNQVVFLFVVATLFSELEAPKWSDYFPKCIHLPVGYLNEQDTVALIEKPYNDFPIQYDAGVAAQIFQLTQGHPTLVQQIGYELIQRTYTDNRLQIQQADLDAILHQRILTEGNGTLSVFWGQFCKQPMMQQTVVAIIEQRPIPDRESLKRLNRHGFIYKTEAGIYAMQVPIFEMWIRKFEVDI